MEACLSLFWLSLAMPCIHYICSTSPCLTCHSSHISLHVFEEDGGSFILCGNIHFSMHIHLPPHLIFQITYRCAYCLNYNQIKWAYGCSCLQIPPPPLVIACGPDFSSESLSPACFCQTTPIELLFSSPLFLIF